MDRTSSQAWRYASSTSIVGGATTRLTFLTTLSKNLPPRATTNCAISFLTSRSHPMALKVVPSKIMEMVTTFRTSTGCMCATYFSWTARDLFCFRFKPLAFLRSYSLYAVRSSSPCSPLPTPSPPRLPLCVTLVT